MKLKESEMYEPVQTLLYSMGCDEVYGEVLNTDVLGTLKSANIIVELKTSLNFKLLDQALDRLRHGHYVYIAIPQRKAHLPYSVKRFLTENKIGVIEVRVNRYSDELTAGVTLPASFNRLAVNYKNKGVTNIREFIKPYNKIQKGGVPSGEAITEYSTTIHNIKTFLRFRGRNNPWATIEEILEHCETHYANPKPSTLSTLQAHWNKSWCEVKKEGRKTYFRFKTEETGVAK